MITVLSHAVWSLSRCICCRDGGLGWALGVRLVLSCGASVPGVLVKKLPLMLTVIDLGPESWVGVVSLGLLWLEVGEEEGVCLYSASWSAKQSSNCRVPSLQSVQECARFYFYSFARSILSLTLKAVIVLVLTGKTPAEESKWAFLLAPKQKAQPTALGTIETRLQHTAFRHS